MGEQHIPSVQEKTTAKATNDISHGIVHHEKQAVNLVYDAVDEEPEICMRTWIALAAMFLLNYVQVVALQGPPAVVSELWSQALTIRYSQLAALLYRD